MTLKLITNSQSFNGLWFTVHNAKSGLKNKMQDYTSIPLPHSSVCFERRASKSCSKNIICRYCYSMIQSSIHPQIRSKMDLNGNTLNDPNYKPTKIKTINGRLRYISFGELSTVIQAVNILRHAKINPTLHKAMWTKQYGKMESAIQEVSGIKRLNLVWSASKLNSHRFVIPKHFTKSFYVYTSKEELQKAKQEAIDQGFKVIECAKQCNTCNHCYDNHDHTIIMEELR